MDLQLSSFTDVLGDPGDAEEIESSQPLSLASTPDSTHQVQTMSSVVARPNKVVENTNFRKPNNLGSERPAKQTGQHGEFRSVEEIDLKYRDVFAYPYFNLVQSRVIDDALYSDKSMVVCAPTGSGKTVIFEMAIVQLLMNLDDMQYTGDFKIIYMAPVKALCTERLSEWYPKFTKLGLMCIEVTGDTNVDFSQLKPYRVIITTPEKWDMLTRRWRDHRALVEVIKLFLIDEVHILNDESRGPVLEAVVSRMKTIEVSGVYNANHTNIIKSSSQSAYRIEQLQKQYQSNSEIVDQQTSSKPSLPVRIRFVAVSATVSNPEDVAAWLGTNNKPAVYYKFGDECRPVKLKRVVEGYPCSEGTSIFKFDIILNYKLWPVIQKYHDGKPTLIFCNTRKSVALTAETLSRELTINFTPEQKAKLTALASTIKNKKLQALVLSGVGCHHAGLLYDERLNIENAFRNRDLPILITTTTLAMGVNLPAHLVIIKNTQQYVNGAYQEYSISTVLQMVGRAGRPQFDTEATAVIMTRLQDKQRYQALVGGDEPLQSYLHKRLAENLNSEAALCTVCDVAQCVEWLRSTFLSVRAAKDPKRYLGLPQNAPPVLISKKIEELCVKAMNGLASSGLITMDEASCIESTEAGRLMSIYYLDLETMKYIMKIDGTESLEELLWIVCESHELADMHLRVDERRTLNTLNRNNAAATIRFPMKGKISTRQMKLNCIIQAILGCLPIPDPSLNQEAMKVMRIADRVCKCLVAYVTRPDLIATQPQYFSAVLNALILNKCVEAHLWENSPYVSKQLKGIGPTFSTLLATAGKVNFTLLEEAHPRDLERIMNKGAPAGNVLRKQVSLLPKYKLTATPIDEKRISIQLLLLNQHQLADNREHLTARDTHKCNVLVGDSENYVLLLTTFKDKDLISIYDGTITYEIRRKHCFEHKILIHCISSSWVGIDVQCDYTFKSIGPPFLQGEAFNSIPLYDTPRKTTKKQTSITDVYKERKRKHNELDIAESKEKKKRDTALVEKFKHLKNSFEVTSKELRDDLNKSVQMSNTIVNEIMQPEKHNIMIIHNQPAINDSENNMYVTKNKNNIDIKKSINGPNLPSITHSNDYTSIDIKELDDEDNFVVDDKIDSILNEIENEIHLSTPKNSNLLDGNLNEKVVQEQLMTNIPSVSGLFSTPQKYSNHNFTSAVSSNKLSEKKKRKQINTRSNYSFIDAIETNTKLEHEDEFPQKDSGFSDTIKNQIEKFLQKTAYVKQENTAVKGLIDSIKTIDPLPQNKETPIINTEPSLLNLPVVNSIPNKAIEYTAHKKENPNKKNMKNEKQLLKSNILNNVHDIDNIVENIERDYNTPMVKPDVRTNYTNNLTKNSTNGTVSAYCDDDLEVRPSIDSNKNFCMTLENISVDNIASNRQSPEGLSDEINNENSKNHTGVNHLCPQKPVNQSGVENQSHDAHDSLQIEHYNKECPGIDKDFSIEKQNKDENDTSTIRKNTYLSQTYDKLLPCMDTKEKSCNNSNEVTSRSNFLCKPPVSTENDSDIRQYQTSQKDENKVNYNDKFIHQYRFCTTKIDVCTQQMSDHQIQIIRKLKLDVDVTEIVSKGDHCSQNDSDLLDRPNDSEHYDQRVKKNRNYQTYRMLKSTRTDIQNENKVHTDENADPPLKLSTNKDCSYLTQLESHDLIAESQNFNNKTEDIASNKSINDKANKLTNIETLKEDLIESKGNSNKEEIEQYKKYLREIAATSSDKTKSIISETSETEKTSILLNNYGTDSHQQSTEETKVKKIDNILQKYEAILRKSNKIMDIPYAEKKVPRHGDTVQSTENMKRPYKISNISNVHVPLPKTLISVEATRSQRSCTNENEDDVLTRIRDKSASQETKTPLNISNIPKITGITRTTKYKPTNYFQDQLSEYIPEYQSPITNISLLELPENRDVFENRSPIIDDPQLELPENYDLDQSMLNPKTLLEQCFIKEEIPNYNEIIPPPSEFCDSEAVYSPVDVNDELEDVCLSKRSDEDQEDYLAEFDGDKSIFDEEMCSVLTPSVEIETWTLTRDDEEYGANYLRPGRNHSQFTPNKSHTVMRRNSPVNKEPLSQNFRLNSNSRQGKLKHFRFIHKNKLKL